MPLLQAMIALQLSTTLATVSVMVFLCYRWREGVLSPSPRLAEINRDQPRSPEIAGERGLLGLVEANDGLDELSSSKFAGSARRSSNGGRRTRPGHVHDMAGGPSL